MRRLTIVKITVKNGIVHVEGVDLVQLSEEEHAILKEILDAEGYRKLPV